MKQCFKTMRDEYQKYVQPKWWFWLSLVGVIAFSTSVFACFVHTIIINSENHAFHEDKRFLILITVSWIVAMFAVSTDWLSKFVDKGKDKELKIKIKEEEKKQRKLDVLKQLYIAEVFLKNSQLVKQYNETSDHYKDLFIEVMFDSYIANKDNLKGLRSHESIL